MYPFMKILAQIIRSFEFTEETIMKGRSPEQYSSSPAGRTSLDKFGAPSTKEDLSPRQEIEKESEFSYFSPWNPTKTGELLLAFCRERNPLSNCKSGDFIVGYLNRTHALLQRFREYVCGISIVFRPFGILL